MGASRKTTRFGLGGPVGTGLGLLFFSLARLGDLQGSQEKGQFGTAEVPPSAKD
jgi:hypothetical protein